MALGARRLLWLVALAAGALAPLAVVQTKSVQTKSVQTESVQTESAKLESVQTKSVEPHPGQAPYDRTCKVCHGEEGRGNAAPALVPFSMDVEELLARVREGGGEMPPISANRVSDDEVKEIAAYLTSLTSPKDPADATFAFRRPPQ